MCQDVADAVKVCAHCILANSVAEDATAYLYAYVNNVPFEVMFLDVWMPREVPSNLGHTKVLTMLEGMCGLAGQHHSPKKTPQ